MPDVQDVLLFSTADWDNPFWTNKQHMALQFAQHGYRVLYVDSLGLRQPTRTVRDFKRIVARLGKALPIPRRVRPGVWRISPLVVPLHRWSAMRRCNDHLLRAMLRWNMSCLGFKKPLVWTYNPLLYRLISTLPHRGVIYHCVDDLRFGPGISASAIEEAEQRLADIADLCFTTSLALQRRMEGVFPHTIYEANVCDVVHFQQARTPLPQPCDLADIPRPRLLFIGALSQYKVDYSLIEQIATAMPQVHWVLIGSVGEGQPGSTPPPSYLPNVHLLGPRPYADLPAYLRHADVAVLPAPHNPYTDAMFPMKFFEYLAAGVPLVSTNLPALSDFSDLFFGAEGGEEFARVIRLVLSGARRDASRIDAACAKHSWEQRFARMEMSFFPLISQKNRSDYE